MKKKVKKMALDGTDRITETIAAPNATGRTPIALRARADEKALAVLEPDF